MLGEYPPHHPKPFVWGFLFPQFALITQKVLLANKNPLIYKV